MFLKLISQADPNVFFEISEKAFWGNIVCCKKGENFSYANRERSLRLEKVGYEPLKVKVIRFYCFLINDHSPILYLQAFVFLLTTALSVFCT